MHNTSAWAGVCSIKTGTMSNTEELKVLLQMAARLGADHGYSKRGHELSQQEADAERKRAETERKRAEAERKRADGLAERLKALEREQRRRERSPSPRRGSRRDHSRRGRSPSPRSRQGRDRHIPRRGRGGLCKFFNLAKGCKKGDTCDFEHVRPRHEVIKAERKPKNGTNTASTQEEPAPAMPDPIAKEFEQVFEEHESGGEQRVTIVDMICADDGSDDGLGNDSDTSDSDDGRRRS